MPLRHILAINPGSTSTKIAVYTNTKVIFLKSIHHSNEDLEKFNSIADQYNYRKEMILEELMNAKIEMDLIEAVVGRGGLLRPIKSGVYVINEKMKEDLQKGILGQHASNLGGLIADDIAKSLPNAKAYIADPVVVDEMNSVAKITGHPEFKRLSIFHALNQKATARSYARLLNKKYEELNLIIAHMGGGISVGAHQKGRVIDVNNGLDGDGPFSPERSGSLPTGQLVDKCFENGSTREHMRSILTGGGGLMAYFGTNSAYQIELQALEGDENSRLIQDAMSYQVAKEIGALATVLRGEVDGIILTGGIANNTMVVEYIKKMVTFIAPVIIYPGEDEMHALAMNGMMVLKGDIKPRTYDVENFVV
ncbi:MAG: butyrate kinase [Bacteroidales bacterium]|nr:butyrate kinase [Bacteroidales bacterium]MCF8391741.1 butyrate kinase [Bacteroidales bacterium]